MTDEQKAYIKEIVREVINGLPCHEHDDRLRDMEKEILTDLKLK